MNIPPLFLFETLLYFLSVFHETDGQNKPQKRCKNPKGNHGSVRTEVCIKMTCVNGKWKGSINEDICCYERTAYGPNTNISYFTANDGCTSTTITCEMKAKVAKIVYKQSTNCTKHAWEDQCQELSAQIVNLTQLLVNHIADTGNHSCSSGEIPVSMTTTENPTTTETTTATTATTTTTTTTTTKEVCDPDWSEFEKSCYKLLDNSGAHYSTRDKCNQDCTSAGGMLTSIHSQAENNFLASLLPQDANMWTCVGGDHVGSKKFVWMDGTEWDYDNWNPGDPDGHQACVWLGWNKNDPSKLIDAPCNYTYFDCICKEQ